MWEKWEGERREGKSAFGERTIGKAGRGLALDSGRGFAQPAVRHNVRATRLE